MTPERPWANMDPNSKHQRWSRWIFGVTAGATRPSVTEVVDNARRYFAAGFGTVGRVRCDQQDTYYCIVVEVDGPDAHDPVYCARVCQDFSAKFVRGGFGPAATLSRFVVGQLAGDWQNGQPPDQLLVMPYLAPHTLLYGV